MAWRCRPHSAASVHRSTKSCLPSQISLICAIYAVYDVPYTQCMAHIYVFYVPYTHFLCHIRTTNRRDWKLCEQVHQILPATRRYKMGSHNLKRRGVLPPWIVLSKTLRQYYLGMVLRSLVQNFKHGQKCFVFLNQRFDVGLMFVLYHETLLACFPGSKIFGTFYLFTQKRYRMAVVASAYCSDRLLLSEDGTDKKAVPMIPSARDAWQSTSLIRWHSNM